MTEKKCPLKMITCDWTNKGQICIKDKCAWWVHSFDMCALAIDGYLKAFDRVREESRG